jgi:hypothetical protein
MNLKSSVFVLSFFSQQQVLTAMSTAAPPPNYYVGFDLGYVRVEHVHQIKYSN